MSKRMLFITAAVVLVCAGIYSRLQDEKQAKSLATAIEAADLANENTSLATQNLQLYVKDHMGTSVSYTLTGSYNRAVAKANAAAAAQNGSGQIYAAAPAACSGKPDSITQANCNQAYLQSHLANLPPSTPVIQPKLANYQYSLHSPEWT